MGLETILIVLAIVAVVAVVVSLSKAKPRNSNRLPPSKTKGPN